MRIAVRSLGQSGFRLDLGGTVVYTDPYLSDSVAALEGPEFRRKRPIPIRPDEVRDADWLLVSHGHRDHCDPETLGPVARSSSHARIICPNEVRVDVMACGVSYQRIVVAREEWVELGDDLRIHAIAAAHPTIARDADQLPRCVGYVLEWRDRRIYHAGDTSVSDGLIAALAALGPIDVGFLPVNECNYFRQRRGIIGNMSVRDAFGLAEAVGMGVVVPMHFDMFQLNSVFPEEIQLIYRGLESPSFQLLIEPEFV